MPVSHQVYYKNQNLMTSCHKNTDNTAMKTVVQTIKGCKKNLHTHLTRPTPKPVSHHVRLV